MKRRIGLLLCIAIILTTFSGCLVKREAGTTGETSNEISPDTTFEITPETTNDSSPEFYDFMTLDPDVDINNEQVRKDIHKRRSKYLFNNANLNFTKKENYLYEIYDEKYWGSTFEIYYILKPSKNNFHNTELNKTLTEFGLYFERIHVFEEIGKTYKTRKFSCSNEEIKQILRILLEDYNVIYAEIQYMWASTD